MVLKKSSRAGYLNHIQKPSPHLCTVLVSNGLPNRLWLLTYGVSPLLDIELEQLGRLGIYSPHSQVLTQRCLVEVGQLMNRLQTASNLSPPRGGLQYSLLILAKLWLSVAALNRRDRVPEVLQSWYRHRREENPMSWSPHLIPLPLENAGGQCQGHLHRPPSPPDFSCSCSWTCGSQHREGLGWGPNAATVLSEKAHSWLRVQCWLSGICGTCSRLEPLDLALCCHPGLLPLPSSGLIASTGCPPSPLALFLAFEALFKMVLWLARGAQPGGVG